MPDICLTSGGRVIEVLFDMMQHYHHHHHHACGPVMA
jgi:hypothetical protein